MTGFASDLKYAVRALTRTPMLTTVAVLSLALGIGANTAIFTLIDQLMLRLLPVKQPEQLVMIWSTGPHLGNNNGSRAASYPMYQDFGQKAEAFSHVFCRFGRALSISFEGRPSGSTPSSSRAIFSRPSASARQSDACSRPRRMIASTKAIPSVVLSHEYWTSASRPIRTSIGKKILVNNYPMTIVGVSAPRLRRPRSVALAADPHSDSDEAADDTRLGRDRRPAQPVDSDVRAHEARLHRRVGAGIPAAALPADPANTN